MSPRDEEEKDRAQRTLNLTLAAVAGQVGCLTLGIIFVALFVGLWLDNQFDSRPLVTIILMIGSVPVTLILMFWVVRKTTARLNSGSTQKPNND
jgi:formate hydrogenlyase subunit 4